MEHLNQTIRVKFGLAISQLVDVVRTEAIDIVMAMIDYIKSWVTHFHPSPNCAKVKPQSLAAELQPQVHTCLPAAPMCNGILSCF